MPHPHVFCRLETQDQIYVAEEFDIHQERQRPTLAVLELEEPIELGVSAILQFGYLNRGYRVTVMRVISCSQIAKKTYDVVCLGAVRDILEAKFIDQLVGVDLAGSLQCISDKIGLQYKSVGNAPQTKAKSIIFLSTVRNALDQIRQIFKFDRARWLMNLLTQELLFLPEGKFETESNEIPMSYFKQETTGGIELEIVPMLRPYVPVKWRENEEIVDIARLNSKTGTLFLTFAEKAE